MALKPSTREVEGSATIGAGIFTGTVRTTYEIDGDTPCDTTISLTGEPYIGDCEGCLYAFSVDAEIVADARAPDCLLDPLWTYVPEDTDTALAWAFAPIWSASDPPLQDAMLTLSTDAEGLTTVTPMIYTSARWSEGSITASGGSFSWLDVDDANGPVHYGYQWCGALPGQSATDNAGASYGGDAYLGDLACGAPVMDTWALQVAAGDTLAVTVDTVAADSAFDPAFFVDGPDGCTLLVADDSFGCTHDPSAGCPSGTLLAPTDGTYEIRVYGLGHCPAGGEDYQLLLRVDPP